MMTYPHRPLGAYPVPIIASASSSSISFISTAITATRKGPYKNYGLIQPENSGKWTRRLGGIGMYEGGKAARSLCRHVHALRCGGMRVTIGGKCLTLDAVVSTRQQLDVLHATKSTDITDELFSVPDFVRDSKRTAPSWHLTRRQRFQQCPVE
jgi:hypothetical protein